MKKIRIRSGIICILLLIYATLFLSGCEVQTTTDYDLGPKLDQTAGSAQLAVEKNESELYAQAPFVAK